MEINDLLRREKARRDTYKSLAECYYLPDGDLIIKLKGLERQLGVLGSGALSYAALMRSELQGPKELKKLAIDFARLFVGPYSLPAPPYGSVYLEGERKIMGDSTLDVQERYRRAGVELSDNFRDVPDHIAAELEFMYFLIFKEIQALENSDVDTAIDYLEKQRAFLREHLGAWVFDFADSIEENAETDFYKNLARATKAFIEQNFDELSDLSAPESRSDPSMSVAN
ncbi:MAG: molecular chaperone [Deltaproteobacteria bacterium]|nr:molecular chaperone [Deltaproteobacteria bacterium]